jgi:hypothetical protein
MHHRDEPDEVTVQEAGLIVGHAFLIGSERARRKTIRPGRST